MTQAGAESTADRALYAAPFDGRELERQLDAATRRFINDPARYRLGGETLHVSRIFDWYGADFNNDPLDFFKRLAQGLLAEQLASKGQRLKVAFLDYDWPLNGP